MARQSRETETRATQEVHEMHSKPWVRGASLQMPPAKPGHDQRWIRFAHGEKMDSTNYSRKLREGWKPRDSESVSDEWQAMHGTQGKITGIMVEGMILCERPLSISRRRTAAMQFETSRRTDALKHDLDGVNNQTKNPAFGPIQKAMSSVPGREVKVKDDEE
jgi:hypothetical protein